MDDEDLYDEFGNYIGPDEQEELPRVSGSQELAAVEQYHQEPHGDEDEDVDMNGSSGQSIVLHENKQYYPSAASIYGPDVEVVTYSRDTQSLSEPIVAPIDTRRFKFEEKDLPEVNFDRGFQLELMQACPDQMRNIALVGSLHQGKTSLMDMFVRQTHAESDSIRQLGGKRLSEQIRYTDNSNIERVRGLSVKNAPMSFMLQSTAGKSYAINVLDTPGHIDFCNEVVAAARLADGFVLVVDVVEGLLMAAKTILEYALRRHVPVVLFVNKMDRLIMDLNIPLSMAYLKLTNLLDEINKFASTIEGGETQFSPVRGNVVFGCASMEWCFTLKSFARRYAQSYSIPISAFAERLWGRYYTPSTGKFTVKPAADDSQDSFVFFVLEPLYKLYAQTLSQDPSSQLKNTLRSVGVSIPDKVYKQDARTLLRTVVREFFGHNSSAPLIDCVIEHVPSPVEGTRRIVEAGYSGRQDRIAGDPNGPLCVLVTDLLSSADGQEFYALARVVNGTIHQGQKARVVGVDVEADSVCPATLDNGDYDYDDETDADTVEVTELSLPQTRYRVPISAASVGFWVLIGGIDRSIVKGATLIGPPEVPGASTVAPFLLPQPLLPAVYKVAVEAINPSELPRLLDGLRKVVKNYSLLKTHVEDSGERVLLGSGELYLDCVMYDLRTVYAQIEIRVSDPSAKFTETVSETSALQSYASSANNRNRLAFVSEPLGDGATLAIEHGEADLAKNSARQVGRYFQKEHGWDALAARSLWAFSPSPSSGNVLLNDTLSTTDNADGIMSVRDSIIQGFSWSTREGPLCSEPIRGVKYRLVDASLATDPIFRGGGQIIPAARRACHASVLLAAPRLLEPTYEFQILCVSDAVDHVIQLVERRRGYVRRDLALQGTPLYVVEGEIPLMDANGFETDVRLTSRGQASVSMKFEKWTTVPGDPLDPLMVARPMEPAQPGGLARDFVVKTRLRKGLPMAPAPVTQYLDEAMAEKLRSSGLLDAY